MHDDSVTSGHVAVAFVSSGFAGGCTSKYLSVVVVGLLVLDRRTSPIEQDHRAGVLHSSSRSGMGESIPCQCVWYMTAMNPARPRTAW